MSIKGSWHSALRYGVLLLVAGLIGYAAAQLGKDETEKRLSALEAKQRQTSESSRFDVPSVFREDTYDLSRFGPSLEDRVGEIEGRLGGRFGGIEERVRELEDRSRDSGSFSEYLRERYEPR
jgi:hypothetical protein